MTKCRKNVRKLSENCPKPMRRSFLTFLGHFFPIWSVFLSGNPVQCMPATSVAFNPQPLSPPTVGILPQDLNGAIGIADRITLMKHPETSKRSPFKDRTHNTGPNFIHPHPPTPENTPGERLTPPVLTPW